MQVYITVYGELHFFVLEQERHRGNHGREGRKDRVLTHDTLGWPKKQQDVLCFWSRSYPGCFLSPDSKNINYFIRR